MSFGFGAAPAASTPAPGGFSFGQTPAAPAPSTGFAFGSPAAAPAGGGLFGSSAAPAPAPAGGGLFGSAAPAPSGGGLFGSNPAPAPTGGGLFGSNPAPAPASGGLFGSTPAPASGGLFGAPAPASGGLFGSSTAPAPAAGGGFFNTAAAQQQPMTSQQPAVQLSASTPYSQLPDNAKRAIDSIYQLMMQHRRTLATVKTMAPSLLVVEGTTNNLHSTNGRTSPSSPADAAAGFRRRNVVTDPSSKPLPQQMVTLQTQINTLLRSAESNLTEAQHLKARAGETACQAKMHGAWPIENVAARSGVALSSIKRLLGDMNSRSEAASGGGGVGSNIPASSLNISGMNNLDALALQHIMDMRAATVDRIETMPSPYLLEVLRSFEQRLEMVYRDVEAVQARLRIAEEAERVQSMGGVGMLGDETSLLLSGGDNYAAMTSLMLYEGAGGGPAHLSKRLATLARSQNDLFLRIASQAARAHDGLEEVKLRYRRFCETMQGGYFEDPFLKADAEEVSRERELQQKIVERQLAAPSTAVGGTSLAAAVPTAPGAAPPSAMGGLFGSTPAPSSGGLFGNNSAPAPSTGGLFGAPAPAPTAPAPASGGLFGAPAPASGGLFGSSTPAPAPSGGLFGAPAAPTPAPGTSLFGAPAPAAPAAGGLFSAPTTPASTLAPRKKPGSRSGGRRR